MPLKLGSDHVEAVRRLLMAEHKYTFLPDVLDVFGYDNLFKFLKVFAGVGFKVPGTGFTDHLIRDAEIFTALHNTPTTTILRRMAQRYGMDVSEARRVYANTCNRLLEEPRPITDGDEALNPNAG